MKKQLAVGLTPFAVKEEPMKSMQLVVHLPKAVSGMFESVRYLTAVISSLQSTNVQRKYSSRIAESNPG